MANLGLLNNNAGNLKDPKTGNFQTYPDPTQGRQALEADLNFKKSGQSPHIKPGQSILALANAWAPASDGNVPSNWANNVAKTVGVDVNTPWDSIPTPKLADGIQVAEGTSTPNRIQTSNQPSINNTGASSLVQKIRAKYPTEYSDLSDSDLEQKVLAKHPEYADLASPNAQKTIQDNATEKANSPSTQIVKGINELGTGDTASGAGDVASGSIRGFGNLITGGGTETLGQSLGTNLGYGYEKVKGMLGGQDNSAYYDMSQPSVGDVAKAGGKTGLAIASIAGAGGLLTNLIKRSSALANPVITDILGGSIGKGETLANLSRQDAINTLGNTLKEMSVNDVGGQTEQLVLKALKELNPTLVEKQSLVRTLGKGGFNFAKNIALMNLLGDKVGGIIHRMTN